MRGAKAVLESRFGILFVASLLQAVFWLAVLHADPFGMSSSADRVSEGIFLRLYPIIYPGEWRDRIQVVMLDEEQLPLTGDALASREWPITFDEHVALIRRILELEPKGVFVDFLFDTEKGRDPKIFQDFIAALPRGGAPVVFASYGDPQKRLVEPLQSLPFENSGEASGGQRALRGLVELTAPSNHYQISDGKGRASAAAALYNATADELNREASGAAPHYSKVDTQAASDMLVAWGNTLPAADAASPACAPVTDDPASRWRALTSSILTGIAGAANVFDSKAGHGPMSWERLQPCAYHGEIAARDLFDNSGRAMLKREAIKGSYVFVGASIDGAGDTVNSPVHGQLPGVFLHAMALDNLLTFKGAHLKTAGWASIPQVVLIFLCTFLGGLVFAERAVPRTRLEAAGSLALRFAAWAVFAAAAAVLLLAFLLQFDWAPYNWGSVLAIAGVVFFAGAGKALLALVRGGEERVR